MYIPIPEYVTRTHPKFTNVIPVLQVEVIVFCSADLYLEVRLKWLNMPAASLSFFGDRGVGAESLLWYRDPNFFHALFQVITSGQWKANQGLNLEDLQI